MHVSRRLTLNGSIPSLDCKWGTHRSVERQSCAHRREPATTTVHCKLRAGDARATVEQYAAPCAGGNARILQMVAKTVKVLKWAAVLVGVSLLSVLALRAYDSQRGPPLQLWHTYVPHELSAPRSQGGLESLRRGRERRLRGGARARHREAGRKPESRQSLFRRQPPVSGAFLARLEPLLHPRAGRGSRGAVVFLHGLTDSPYSGRNIARLYRDHGYVCVAIRLPGHGTVPSGLTAAQWEDWSEATRLAVREARRRIGPDRPLHMVGYSNGGALAMKYALDGSATKHCHARIASS